MYIVYNIQYIKHFLHKICSVAKILITDNYEELFNLRINFNLLNAPSTLTIVAGACFALALRFAGTANKAAFNIILFYLNTTHRIGWAAIKSLFA